MAAATQVAAAAALCAAAPAQAADEPWEVWSIAPTIGAFVAAAGALVLAAMFVPKWRRAAKLERDIAATEEQVAEIMGWPAVTLDRLPAELARLKRDVETVLGAFENGEQAHVERPGRIELPPAARGAVAAAVAFAEVTQRMIAGARRGSLVQRLDASLQLASDIEATIAALQKANVESDAAVTLANILRAGELNHVMTMGPLLTAYFGNEDDAIALRAAYQTCGALIELALAEVPVIVLLLQPLSTAARGTHVEYEDQRGLRQIQEVRDVVAREARKLHEDEYLIVDCLAPGWHMAGELRRPQIVAYARAGWTA
ncbi:MAG: hypothetical protein E6G97_21635 [Alphaproteobacteria bacterium]|nr:MAG: hypothetical protein E6G97_21635 [Alphaproteobacteria bacterium]